MSIWARPAHWALACAFLLAVVAGCAVADAERLRGSRRGATELAGRLGVSDLCLFPEARYTRHWTQADRWSAYQDHPGAREHAPAGSLVGPR